MSFPTKWLLLPGMDGTGLLYQPLLATMHADHRVQDAQAICYPSEKAWGYGELTNFVAQQLPPEQSVALIAESFSGPIACALAAQFPAQISHVVFACTFVRNPLSWLPFADMLALTLPFLPIDAMPRWPMALQLFNGPAPDALSALFAQAAHAATAQTLRARLKSVLEVDARKALLSMPQRALYLQAADDRVVSAAAQRQMQAVKPTMTTATIPGPHCLLQTAPELAWQAIVSWLTAAD